MHSIKPNKVLVIVPAYNEEGSIKSTVESLSRSPYPVDYVVINDGSRDNTLLILEENHINHINLPVNLGLHGAVQAGLMYADKAGYACIVQFDGDGQHRPEYLPILIDAILNNETDVAIGSRFVSAKKPHSFRMLGSRIISWAILLLTQKKIHDPTSGMRAYNKELIHLMANNPNYGPEPDTIAYLIQLKKIVKEYQVEMDDRTTGVSYLNVTASIKYMLRMMVSILLINPFR